MAKQSAFQIFNQKLKEKIGVAEQVTTYPEEPELSNKLEVMTNQIKKITRELHKQEKTTSTLLEAGAELSDSLVDGGVSFREDPLRYMLAGSLDKVAEVQRHVDDLRTKLGKQIVSEVYEPLDNVIEVDVKEAKAQRSKFEKSRVELDTGISKLNGLGKKAKEEKIKEVELEVEDLRKNFSQVGMETVDKLQDTIALSEAEMLGSLVHYMELYRDFFVNSNRFMVTLIPEIEEYKNYIEMQKDQLHGSAIAKQIEAAAAAAPPEKKFGTLKLKGLKSSFGIGDKKKVDKGTPASEIFTAKAENDPFGKDIEQVANKDGSDVPAIVDKAVDYIENKGLQEEGIFRISASKKEVDQIKGEIAQTADETTSSPEVVAEKKPDESSSSSESEKKRSKKEEKEKDGKKDPVRQRSAGSLMIKKTSEEDLRKQRRLERAHTISVGIADPNHPVNMQPLPDTPSKKEGKSGEEPHEEGAKKKHAPTSPRFKSFIKKLSFRADKKDKVEKKEDKSVEAGAEAKPEKDEKKHEKKDKEKKVDLDQKKLEKEKKDEEKRLEKERKDLEKKKKKEVEAAEKEAKKHDKKDKKKKDESTPPESKSSEDHKKELKKSTKDKDKKEESSSSESVVKYEYRPVDAHMSVNLPAPQAQGATPEATVSVTTPAAEVEHKSGEEEKVETEVKVEAETETKSVEEKKPEVEVEVKNRSRSSSSSSSKAEAKPEVPHEPVVEVLPTTEVVLEVHGEAKVEPVHEVKEATEVKEPEAPKEDEAKPVEFEVPKPEIIVKEEKLAPSVLTLSGEDDKDKEKKKREKEEKARKEKEESAKKKAEKEAKKKEKEEKEREEKERKKAEKDSKKKPTEKEKEKEKEKPEKETKKKDKKVEAGANEEESSSSSEEKEKKGGKKSPKWLQKLKPKTPRKKEEVEKTSPRDETTGDLVLNRKKKAVVVEPNDLESSINSPRPQLTDSASDKAQDPTSNSASEVKLKLESTEKARAENQTHIEEQTRSVLSSVGSKLDELENQLNTLDLSISPRGSTTLPAEASPRGPDTPASREKLGSELQNLEAMLNNIPEQANDSVKKETVTPVVETEVTVSTSTPVDEKPKETKDDHSSSSSS